MDQCFSILATELKKEDLLSVNALKLKIAGSPINPKPVCKSLDFIYDWKLFVTPKLSDPQLKNHSKYNGFVITNEADKGVLK